MAEAKVATNRPNSASPPPNCAICLGSCTNKCFSDSCMHQFCFNCLLEWSKIKAECPLCKQPFKSIIHNVKSNDEYDEHVVENIPTEEIHIIDNEQFIYYPPPQSSRHQFHFRTTFTVDTRGEHAIQQMLLTHPLTNGGQISIAGFAPSRNFYQRRRRDTSATSFRRSIYNSNLWVNAPPDVTGRYRDVSPHFYRSCPAARTRLVPWLNRELNALLYENTQLIMHLVDIIMENLLLHHICSRTFRTLLYEYLSQKTDHFIHEFYNFMRSPFDMIGYDRHIIYTERPSSPTRLVDVLSDNDSDVILVGETSPSQPVVIDLVNTDSDEPILISAEGPSFTSERHVEAENRAPILPLKLRLKHKRQSRERRTRNKKRHRKRSRSSSSSSSTSSSSDSDKEVSYKKYKRRRKIKKHKSKRRENYVISSDSESEVYQIKHSTSDSDDNLPLSTFANKKKHKKHSKRKSQEFKIKSNKSHTVTSNSTKDSTKKDNNRLSNTSMNSLPSCSRYLSDSSNNQTSTSSSTSVTTVSRENVSEVPTPPLPPNDLPSFSRYSTNGYSLIPKTEDFPSPDQTSQKTDVSSNVGAPSTSSSVADENNVSNNSDESIYEDSDEYGLHPVVKSEVREVKQEDRNEGPSSSSGRLRNIVIKKEGSSNMWYSCPCDYQSEDSDSDN